MCSAVLATDVKHDTAPEEWYWSEKLISRGPTEPSVSTLGFHKQRTSGLQTDGVTASISTEPSLKPKPKVLNTHFRRKHFQVSYCLLSLLQTLPMVNLLRIKTTYNSCQGKYSFPCWINIHQTHLALSEVSMFMNHKIPKTPCPLTALHGHHSTGQMRQLWRGNNKMRTIKANTTLGSEIYFSIFAARSYTFCQ